MVLSAILVHQGNQAAHQHARHAQPCRLDKCRVLLHPGTLLLDA